MSQQAFQFERIRAQLQQPGDGVFRDAEWLEASWQDPEAFARALLRHHSASTHAPLKSSPEAGYDLYHDLVLRHQNPSLPALLWTELEPGLHSLSYAQLHAACTQRRATWMRQGVKAGEALCIVAPLGPELLIDLLTGLRMGLRVSLLPPLGPDFLAVRLGGLANPWIATAPRYRMLLIRKELQPRVLESSDEASLVAASAGATSHTYAPDEPMLALFSPLRQSPTEPAEVTAAVAYGRALRDGLLLLGLAPGKVLAAPEHLPLQYQPALLLATLLQGATFLHIGAEDFAPRRALATEPRMDILLVSAVLRDALLRQPAPRLPGLELWIMNPQEPPAQVWGDFAHRCGLAAVPAALMLVDAACGGCLLFSLRRRGSPPRLLMPAPGMPFALRSANDSGIPAQDNYGVWDPLPATAGILLSRRDGAYIYTGTLAPTHQGRCYPAAEVEEVALSRPFVIAATVVLQNSDTSPIALLVFTGPEPLEHAREQAPRRAAALRESIIQRLGKEFLPTVIEQYAMYPRCRNAALDHEWCARQYQRGTLRAREEQALFRLLDRLRLACARPQGLGTAGKAVGSAGTP